MLPTILHYISGPIIGAIIGAFTNYLAIKMLFRPLKPVKIGKFTLPFTPGIIPRHQGALADALADTVNKNFFTNTDIEGIFMTEEMQTRFSEGIYQMLTEVSLEGLSASVSEETKLKIKEAGYNKLHRILRQSNIAALVTDEVQNIIDTKIKGGVVSRIVLTDELTKKLAGYIGKQAEDYLLKNDLAILYQVMEKQKETLKDADFLSLCREVGIEKEDVLAAIRQGYVTFMNGAKEQIADSFHIKQFIHDKIMELNPGDIEFLVNQAIKREMNYLVYLGGFLGLIIGVVNIFV